jgi:hypothetical protein
LQDSQARSEKAPLGERGLQWRANQYEFLAVAVTLSAVLPALLPALLAWVLVLLAGVLGLLTRLLATALLLAGLLPTLLLAALVRVLRVLAHRFLPWVPALGSTKSGRERSAVPQKRGHDTSNAGNRR